jgi:hypothetical protein
MSGRWRFDQSLRAASSTASGARSAHLVEDDKAFHSARRLEESEDPVDGVRLDVALLESDLVGLASFPDGLRHLR